MHLTKKSKYALLGLAYLVSRERGATVSLGEVAKAQALPATFLAKIFQELARHGVLEADRGRGSGYVLRRAPSEVRVREVVEAVEGSMALKRCLLWSNDCSESDPCPLHYRLEQFHTQLDSVLNEVTLAEYADTSTHVRSHERGATS
jgi:Rrf2 family protein